MKHPFRDPMVLLCALNTFACLTSDGDGGGGATSAVTTTSVASTSGGLGGAGGDDDLALAAACRARTPPCAEVPEWPRCVMFEGYVFPTGDEVCAVENDCSGGQAVQVCEWTAKNPGYGAPTITSFEREEARYVVWVANSLLPWPEGWLGCQFVPACEPPSWWEEAQ